jgi:hypothetical protein
MSYLKHIQQEVTASTINSSTVNLKKYPDSGYNFIGVKESTLGVAGIQVSLYADQNCNVYVEQSPDGDNWDISDYYLYKAITNPNFGITVQAVSSYFRVRVENASTISDTTAFRLQSALCPIVEALPRALDENGNLAVGIKSLQDAYGFETENTPIGEMRVVEPFRMVGRTFLDGTTLDTNYWTATVDAGAGPGSVAQSGGVVVINSGTTTTSYARLSSVRRARYVSGSSMRYRATVQLGDGGTASNKKRWGVAYGATMPTVTDGAWFQTDGVVFGICTAKNGTSDAVVTSGNFNGEYGKSFVLDTNAKVYEIYWTNTKVWFVVDGKILHTVSAFATTWTETVNLYLYFDNVNSGNTVNKTLSCRVASIARLGKSDSAPIWVNINTAAASTRILKRGAGKLRRVIVNSSVNSTIISLYDALSAANPIAIISPPNGATPFAIDYDLDFYTGLVLTTTPNSANITVVWE